MFVKFPRQKALIPCSSETRLKQSIMPLYRVTWPEMIFGFASCVWIRIFTRSIGAVQVLAIAPEIPPAMKFAKKSYELDIVLKHEKKLPLAVINTMKNINTTRSRSLAVHCLLW
mmetsp:Transcript_18392/g.27908  ORF Transcript_18392/g.27908 Transcript_18392/m.27908 type:complete len:114 (-) Transcript_18392:8-349(-)